MLLVKRELEIRGVLVGIHSAKNITGLACSHASLWTGHIVGKLRLLHLAYTPRRRQSCIPLDEPDYATGSNGGASMNGIMAIAITARDLGRIIKPRSSSRLRPVPPRQITTSRPKDLMPAY